MKPSKPLFTLSLVFMVLVLAGCRGQNFQPTPQANTTPPRITLSPSSLPVATEEARTPTSAPLATTATPQSVAPEDETVTIYCDPAFPSVWRQRLRTALQEQSVRCVDDPEGANVRLAWLPLSQMAGEEVIERFYAVVAPFATVQDDVSLTTLQAFWIGEGGPLIVAEEAAEPLSVIFGGPPAHTAPASELLQRLQEDQGSLGILPFDQLDPAFKTLTVDGKNILDKNLSPATYPLAVGLSVSGHDADSLLPHIAEALQPKTNRDTDRMTTLIMTGVTAMSRGTAEKMEQKGYLYPTLKISDTLRAADITHVSNEVPFIKGCQVNNTYMNLILCSDYPYVQALEAIGVDIVGLSGNHVNDFGREGALESLSFYKQHDLPVYGSGVNVEEACKPLLWEDHGNTYAFLAALAWWPEEAWATETEPGACYYYDNYEKIFATIRQLRDQVDIVSVELQFEETYDPWPTQDQVREFRALHEAGADIVTGVQSHVPQAVEPYSAREPGGPAIILYGLGNLFFDQMQSWETRTGLIARHTIYQGRLLSTELLTTVLEDFAQPRWATSEERAAILKTIFEAAPPKNPSAAPNATPVQALPDPVATPATTPLHPAATPTPEPPAPAPAPTSTPTSTPVLKQQEEDTSRAPSTIPAMPQPTPPPVGVAQLPWPNHLGADKPHFLLARPTSPEFNQLEDNGYAFGSTANGRYRAHHGVDIANPMGTPLLAPADGVVLYAGRDDAEHQYGPYPNFYGNVLVIQLDQSWEGRIVYALYGHMKSIDVRTGDRVVRGQPVARTGMEGIAIGPHVHVEVRLDDPQDYNNVYNTALWMEPFAGYGVLAGQVITEDGRAWHEVKLHIYRLTDVGSRLYRVITTYAMDPGLRPDPVLAENAVLGSVPAGQYEVVIKLGGKTYRQRVYVAPGEVGWFRFTIQP